MEINLHRVSEIKVKAKDDNDSYATRNVEITYSEFNVDMGERVNNTLKLTLFLDKDKGSDLVIE
jgi:hypothetical protein